METNYDIWSKLREITKKIKPDDVVEKSNKRYWRAVNNEQKSSENELFL